MAEETRLILIVASMAAVTYLARALPLHLDVSRWPPFVRDALEFLPVSIVSAITLPALVSRPGGFDVEPHHLLAAIPTLLCAYGSRNMLASVFVGTAAYLWLAS